MATGRALHAARKGEKYLCLIIHFKRDVLAIGSSCGFLYLLFIPGWSLFRKEHPSIGRERPSNNRVCKKTTIVPTEADVVTKILS